MKVQRQTDKYTFMFFSFFLNILPVKCQQAKEGEVKEKEVKGNVGEG